MQIAAIGWLALTEAAAFNVKTTEEGEVVRWRDFPVEWRWAQTKDALPEAASSVGEAFDAWAEVDETELAFRGKPTSRAPTPGLDRTNLVWVERDWPFDEDQIAMTDVWTDEEGAIVAFDIQINGRVAWSTSGDPDAYDLQAAVLHEVGHAIGLDHSEVQEASMFPSTDRGAIWRRALSPDDVEAARFLYEAPEASAPRPPLPLSCATVPSSLGWLGALAALALLRRGGER